MSAFINNGSPSLLSVINDLGIDHGTLSLSFLVTFLVLVSDVMTVSFPYFTI